jgi:hypothetical protein
MVVITNKMNEWKQAPASISFLGMKKRCVILRILGVQDIRRKQDETYLDVGIGNWIVWDIGRV